MSTESPSDPDQPQRYQPGGVTGKGFVPGKSGNPKGRPKRTSTLEDEMLRILSEKPLGAEFDRMEGFAKICLDEALTKRNPRLMIALLNRLWPQPRPTPPAPTIDMPIKIIYLPPEPPESPEPPDNQQTMLAPPPMIDVVATAQDDAGPREQVHGPGN